MGVERAVTRWYALRQILVEEIARLEGALAFTSDSDGEVVSVETLREQLTRAQVRLRFLGPCPKSMMI